jgi:hypothetical protein
MSEPVITVEKKDQIAISAFSKEKTNYDGKYLPQTGKCS